MHRLPRTRSVLLVAGASLAALVPAGAASAACRVHPLSTGTVAGSATQTVLSLPRFLRATLVCSTVRGRVGARGATGSTGVRGRGGARGLIGATGLQGLVGASGPTGSQGLTGATGPQGPPGKNGTNGTDGTNGTNGLIGYASVYNQAAQSVAIESDVTFDGNGPMSAGFTHAAGAAGVVVVNGGVFEAKFEAATIQASQFALFRNGVLVTGSTFGQSQAPSQNSGQMIVTLSSGDVLTVRNHTSATAVTLQTLAGGSATTANASLLIEQLG